MSICPKNPNSVGDITENGLIVYPNPVSDYVFFSSPGEITDITIYNNAGKMMKKIANPQDKISVSELTPGLYVVSFTNADGVKENKTIIKK